MSLPVPLSVRVGGRDITERLADLTFREVANGGYASASLPLLAPLDVQPDYIGDYVPVVVYDNRTGLTVWEGSLEDPGRSAGSQGSSYDLTAIGPSGHTLDNKVPLIYVDRRMDLWDRVENVTPGGQFGVSGNPSSPADSTERFLVFQFPNGQPLVTNSRVVARYSQLQYAGQKLARYDYSFDAGRTVASLKTESLVRKDGTTAGPPAAQTPRSDSWNTAGVAASPRVIGTDWTAGHNTLDIRIIWTGAASAIGDDITWSAVASPVVVGTRFDAAGTELVTGASYTTSTVLASQVFADLLGRLLPRFDGANAVIQATTFPIEQLAYEDGATPQDIINDLLGFEPDYRWGAYETNLATGKHRVEWVAWPTTVRYEAEILDGYSGPGSSDGLYDRVTVRWRDKGGRPQSTQRSTSVPALTAAGRSPRTGWIDIGDSTLTQAQRAGDQWLLEHSVRPNQGSLTVARPLVDLVTGRTVMPWEIKAGELIRVRGVQPRIDALNASDRDGVTVFRIVSREYRAREASAVLELDAPARTMARLVAELKTRPLTRRR